MKSRVSSNPNALNDSAEKNRQGSHGERRGRSCRAIFLTWLRKIHLYVGLWGALLGMLFGITGFLLNHRAILKIPVTYTAQKTVQVPLPEKGFSSPQELSVWLQQELKFKPVAPPVIKSEPAKKVFWAGNEFEQPPRWAISLNRPDGGVNAEYFVGNRFVKLDHVDTTLMGTLARLHMSVGVNAFWVLLTDTIAGALILLSITGILLWTQLHTIRTAAVFTSIGALLAGMWFVLMI